MSGQDSDTGGCDQKTNGLYFVRAELGVDHGPYHVVALHAGCYRVALARFSVGLKLSVVSLQN